MNGWQAIQAIKNGWIVQCVNNGAFFTISDGRIVCSFYDFHPLRDWAEPKLNAPIFGPDTTFKIHEPNPAPLDGKTAEIDGRKYKLTAVE